MTIMAEVKDNKRMPLQEQRDRLFSALRGVQHSYRRGYHLTDAQRATIDQVLRDVQAEGHDADRQ